MSELFFKIIFAVLWIIYIIIRLPHDKKYKKTEKIKSVNPAAEKILLLLVLLGLILIPFFWVLTPFLDYFYFNIPVFIRLFGVLLSIISLVYFWLIHKSLGENWSPTLEIRKGHELITSGPYKRIRHPMYAQIWLWVIAQALIISNFIAGLSGLLVWAIVYNLRVSKEEKMMIENFGNKYIDYMKITGRIFPKIFK